MMKCFFYFVIFFTSSLTSQPDLNGFESIQEKYRQNTSQYEQIRTQILASQCYLVLKGGDSDMSEILPDLYLGSKVAAKNILYTPRIHHVLSIQDHPTKLNMTGIYQKAIILSDSSTAPLLSTFAVAFPFIENAEGPVLVHCHRGHSRSGAMMIGFLMYTFDVPFMAAYVYVKIKRPSICPNLNFIHQLKLYERFLKLHPHTLPY